MPSIALPAPSEERGLGNYLREIRAFPILSPEEEFMCARRWREHGDREAAHRLVTSHLRLVVKIARRYSGYRLPFADLIAEGNVGLMKAVRKFDPDRGFRLATYAMWWIKAEIMEFVLRSWSLVRIGPMSMQKRLFFSLRRARARLNIMEQEQLTADQIDRLAAETGAPVDDIAWLSHRMAARDVSLNQPVGDDEAGDERIDWLRDESADPERRVAEAEERAWRERIVAQAMAVLSPRDREIVGARWLGDGKVTLEELGRRYGISRERVRQIEERAMRKMKAAIADLLEGEAPAAAVLPG